MKKIIISLAALAAVSATSFANDRTEDFSAAYRNVHFGSVNGVSAGDVGQSDSQALAVSSDYRNATVTVSDKRRGVEIDNGRD